MTFKSAVRGVMTAGAILATAASAAIAGGPFPGPAPNGPDITICQWYGLTMTIGASTYRNGSIVGLTGATTSWNIGNVNAKWEQSPDSDHPVIAINLFQLKDGRFRQVGANWVKHGFFALSNTQCGAHPFLGGNCRSTNGSSLGVGCTDTYSAQLNGSHTYLGPRFEVNPWTGVWNYANSGFQTGGLPTLAISRRCQVNDSELGQNVNNNNTAQYFTECYYVAADDVDVWNSAGWKPVTVTGNSGATYTFGMSNSSTDENSGFGFNAWTGARQTVIAQQLPIVEKWTADNDGPGGLIESPDGRAVILSKVTSNGDMTWNYEYAVYNIDMDRQIGSFRVPIPAGVTITNVGFYNTPQHEAFNAAVGDAGRKAIDNLAWTSMVDAGSVEWSTVPFASGQPSNPLRWGNMYNFWFTATTGPTDGLVTAGLFKPGVVGSIDGLTDVPQAPPPPPFCLGDANGDGQVNFADLTQVLTTFGATYTPGSAGLGDSNNDGSVDFGDITTSLTQFGSTCP